MLWGGRFKEEFDKEALKFSSSLKTDINLINEDILVSKAHAEMLEKVSLISSSEKDKIINGLDIIKILYGEGKWKLEDENYEDIHSAIEIKLYELIGEIAGKLHTGRSRNDQVATDTRLWVKRKSKELISLIKEFQLSILIIAEDNIDTIIPGYTHLQRAQPVSFAFHLLAYVEMMERDKKRLKFVYDESDYCPLGSGAIAGSTLPLDREFTAEKLNFKFMTANALDAVSDRDYILDFLNSCTTGMLHLSRIAEELILWSTAEWNFIKLSEKYTTGSSLMPQKKNPDLAELIRGKAGRQIGNYTALAAILKGLPLGYNRDMQEDKELLFNSHGIYCCSIQFANRMISTMEINKAWFEKQLESDYLLATDLADWIVSQGVPFREAHSIAGETVKYCESKGKKFSQLTIEELQAIHQVYITEVLPVFQLENCLIRKKTPGSPNPLLVEVQIKNWRGNLSK